MFEITMLWRHLTRDVLSLQGRTGALYAYALVNDAQAMKIVFTPLSVSLCFLSVLSLSSSFLLPLLFFLKSFLQLNTIGDDFHLRLIQILCLHFSRSTPLRKTLTINHYLRIEYFQQPRAQKLRVISGAFSLTR